MNRDQQRAHNILTHTLWPEWEEYCRGEGNTRAGGKWVAAVQQAFGCIGAWTALGYVTSDYEVAGEYYTWIPLD
jgi:hypothetical protein